MYSWNPLTRIHYHKTITTQHNILFMMNNTAIKNNYIDKFTNTNPSSQHIIPKILLN